MIDLTTYSEDDLLDLQQALADERKRRAKLPPTPKRELTHCKRGHEFTEENTYRYKNKAGKECKTCRNMRMQRWLRKKHPAK